jgi:hypothetical protein
MAKIIKSVGRYGLGQSSDVKLPEGWRIIEHPHDFLKCIDHDGRIYIIGNDGKYYPLIKP